VCSPANQIRFREPSFVDPVVLIVETGSGPAPKWEILDQPIETQSVRWGVILEAAKVERNLFWRLTALHIQNL
jgi:hypothetical protein